MQGTRYGTIASSINRSTPSFGTYYFSSVTGDDSRTPAQAQNPVTPWRTISKMNSYSSSMSDGDVIALKAGETFYGTITPGRGGITYTSYGAGTPPIVTGLEEISEWTSLGSNLWESLGTFDAGSRCNMVVISDVLIPMGRYPTTGYLTYTDHSGNSSITGGLSGTPNWTGAEVVIRKNRYILGIGDITSQSGGTLNYSNSGNSDTPSNGYGYFIQNDIRTLDTQNEWFYDTSTNKLKIYSTSTPPTVEVATLNNVVYLRTHDGITFDGIHFRGSNDHLFDMDGVDGTIIQNCTLSFAGRSNIYSQHNTNISILDNIITDGNRNGVEIPTADGNHFISGNTITNIGLYPGMIGRVETNYVMRGITFTAYDMPVGVLVHNNVISGTGYHGIEWQGWVVSIYENLISSFCSQLDDGGGIYTYNGSGNTNSYDINNRQIYDNIVLDGVGAPIGTDTGLTGQTFGIYFDDGTNNVTLLRNTSANNAGGMGFLSNYGHDLLIQDNIWYNNLGGQFKFNTPSGGTPVVENVVMAGNQFYARTNTQYTLHLGDIYVDPTTMFDSDNNYFARPIAQNATIIYVNNYNDPPPTNYSLSTYQAAFFPLEQISQTAPHSVGSVSDIRFEYNATSSPINIDLGAPYYTIDDSLVTDITLQPFSSAVLTLQ